MPDVDALETKLAVGQSTAADVRSVLGEPAGEGRVMMPDIDPAPRDAWSYYYSRGTAAGGGDVDTRRIFLVVYFDDDRYDGYQWFSTLPEHARYRP